MSVCEVTKLGNDHQVIMRIPADMESLMPAKFAMANIFFPDILPPSHYKDLVDNTCVAKVNFGQDLEKAKAYAEKIDELFA